MYCTGGNATEPIWRVLASSDGISYWTPLNLNIVTLILTLSHINSGVLTFLLFPHLSSSLKESLPSLNLSCHNWCSIHARRSKSFHTFLWHFFQVWNIILLYMILLTYQISFLKSTSCDNQALVGCIPIPAVAVHWNLESEKLVSHLIRCRAITYWMFKCLLQF